MLLLLLLPSSLHDGARPSQRQPTLHWSGLDILDTLYTPNTPNIRQLTMADIHNNHEKILGRGRGSGPEES